MLSSTERFVDYLTVLCGNKDDAEQILFDINCAHQNIKFIWEVGKNNKISFLNLRLKNDFLMGR